MRGFSYARDAARRLAMRRIIISLIILVMMSLPLYSQSLVDLEKADLYIVLYVATEQARQHLQEYSQKVWGESVANVHVEVV